MKYRLIYTIVMSAHLSFFMTLWVTWINLGFSDEFIGQWMHAFVLAWPAAGVISFMIGPMVQGLSKRLNGLFATSEKQVRA